MEKSTIIIIAVIAAIVVGLPLAGKLMKSSESAPAGDAKPPEGVEGGGSAPAAPPAAPVLPPALDANSLSGTVWQMPVDKATLTVTLQGGGTLTAQSPMLRLVAGTDTVGGTWSVNGATLTITASAGGKTFTENATISGDQIIMKGKPAKRLQ